MVPQFLQYQQVKRYLLFSLGDYLLFSGKSQRLHQLDLLQPLLKSEVTSLSQNFQLNQDAVEPILGVNLTLPMVRKLQKEQNIQKLHKAETRYITEPT